MASNAVNLAGLSDVLTADVINDRVGIASTAPTTTLDVKGTITADNIITGGSIAIGDVTSGGIITAVSFDGDGSNLTGIVTTILAGDNISVSSPTGIVTIGLSTANISVDNLVVSGISTFNDTINAETLKVGITTINSSGINSPLGIGTFNEVRFRDVNTTNEIGIGASANDFIVSATSGGERLRVESGGNVGLGSTIPTVSVDISEKTDAVALPVGTTAQRPSTAYGGYIRWNSTSSALEVYNGTNWVEIISDYFPSGSTILG
jgi:hypothetical protein